MSSKKSILLFAIIAVSLFTAYFNTKADAVDNFVWVANFGSNTVSKIDKNSNAVAATIGAQTRPFGVAVDPDFVWVANRDSHTVSKINKSTGTVTNITVQSSPLGVAVDNAFVWVASSSELRKIDRLTNAVTFVLSFVNPCSGGRGVAVDKDFIWVTSENFASVTKTNKATGSQAACITLPARPQSWLALDANFAWVPLFDGNKVSKIDKTTNTIVANINVQTQPIGVAVDSIFVWVSNFGSHTVSKINKSTNAVDVTISVQTNPLGVAVDNDFVWAANLGSHTVSKINKSTNAVDANITVGTSPLALDTGFAYDFFFKDTTSPTVTINSPAHNALTNQASITVTATSDETGTAVVKVNNVQQGSSQSVTANTSFSFIVNLSEGANLIGVEVTDAAHNTGSSGISVTRDTVAPVIFNNPIASLTNNSTLTLSGTVTDATSGIASFTINNQAVILGDGGAYSKTITLSEGSNTIIEIATDLASNQQTVTKQIVLDTQPPSVTISSPNQEAVVPVSTTVTFSASDANSPLSYIVFLNNAPVASGSTSSGVPVNVSINQTLATNAILVQAKDPVENAGTASVTVHPDDGDGIEWKIDTKPLESSIHYTDGPTALDGLVSATNGGSTFGFIDATGGLTLTITELDNSLSAGSNGVVASASGSGTEAVLKSCSLSAPFIETHLTAGDTATITCQISAPATVKIIGDDDLHVRYHKVAGYACIKDGKQHKNCKLPLKLGQIGDSRDEVVTLARKKIYKLADLGATSFGQIKDRCKDIHDGTYPVGGAEVIAQKDEVTSTEVIGVPAVDNYVVIKRVQILDPVDGVTHQTIVCKPVNVDDFKDTDGDGVADTAKRKLKVMKTVKPSGVQLAPADDVILTGTSVLPLGSSLWSLSMDILGEEALQKEVMTAAKKLAQHNEINVPEWGLNNGKFDARKLSAGFVLDLKPIIDYFKELLGR